MQEFQNDFVKMIYTSFPSSTTHEEAWLYNYEKRLSWEHDKPGVPGEVEMRCGGPELKGGLGLIFWTGATHTCQPVSRETKPLLWDLLFSPTLPQSLYPSSRIRHLLPPRHQKSDYIWFIWFLLNSPQRNDGKKFSRDTGFENHVLEGAPTKIIKPSSGHARFRLSQANVGSIHLPNKYYWVVT